MASYTYSFFIIADRLMSERWRDVFTFETLALEGKFIRNDADLAWKSILNEKSGTSIIVFADHPLYIIFHVPTRKHVKFQDSNTLKRYQSQFNSLFVLTLTKIMLRLNILLCAFEPTINRSRILVIFVSKGDKK